MGFVKNSIRGKLAAGFGFCVLLMGALVWLNFAHLQRLEKLYRESMKHTARMELATDAQYIGSNLQMIIGHAVINRDLARSEREWTAAKKENLAKLRQVALAADIPEEETQVRMAQTAYDDIVRLYEEEMLPLLRQGTMVPGPLSDIDARLDKSVEAINRALQRIARIESEENLGASRQFHVVLGDTLRSGLTVSLIGVIAVLFISIRATRLIVQPLSEMTRAALEMEKGDYSVVLIHRSDDETGVLANAFRRMAGEVQKRTAELKEMNGRLVAEIEERRLAEEEVRTLNAELEQRVADRLAELAETVTALKQEIAQRTRAESALRESEERYALAVRGANDGIWDWDLKTDATYMSPRLKNMLGYEDAEIPNHADEWRSRIHPEEYDSVMAHLNSYLEGRIPAFEVECRTMHKDGGFRWVLCRGTCLRDGAGKPYRMAGSLTDITERKLFEEALKRSESLVRAVLGMLPVGIWVTDRDGNIILSNDAARRIWSGGKDAPRGVIGDFIGWRPESGERLRKDDWPLAKAISRGEPVLNQVIAIECHDGSRRIIDNSAVLIRNSDNEVIAAVEVVEDITERVEADRKLKESHEQLRNLSVHLESSREKERSRIALEIHDELGQLLTALKFDLSWLKRKIPGTEQVLVEKVRTMIELVDTTIKTVQRISTDLRPRILDHLGLVPAIEWYTQQFTERSGISCALGFESEELDLDQEISINLFRMVQESLTNVLRHANASHIDILLRRTGDRVVLRIVDNGTGIGSEELNDPMSVGLTGMRERAHARGGKVSIRGIRGKGTCVRVTMPVSGKGGADDTGSHS